MTRNEAFTFAIETLREAGAVLERREDRFGDTKGGWWLDGVYLAKDPRDAVRVMQGGL